MSQIETSELSLHSTIPEKGAADRKGSGSATEIKKLTEERGRNEAKVRRLNYEIKSLIAAEKGLRRKERNHRIFTRGGMLEAFLQEPLLLTNDQVYALLKIIFHKPEIDRIRKQLIEDSKRRIAEEETR